ncbi:MAG: hypothetical protein HY508_10645 [Acidobacteria bacterium]|nr:hypothetical protein [Acidobacteriota bacterium]
MKSVIRIGMVGLVATLYVVLLAPAGIGGQDDAQTQRKMTLQDVKDRLNQNKNYLKDAEKKGKAGDAAGVQTALENYDRNMEGINHAMSAGGFEGTDSQREDAYNRVEKATRKHGEVLANLESKVPEQARSAIQHAMEVSQKGRTTALANLQQVRGERQEREQAEMRRQQQMGGGFGRNDGMGRPAGVGGSASGVGGGMGAGRPAGAGPGASAGRGPR